MKKVALSIGILLYLVGTFVYAKDLTSTNFIVRDPSIGTGGGYQSSTSFKMYSAGNLNISGNAGTSSSYIGRDGFLQFPLATSGIVTPTVSGADINLTWTATTVADGYTISGYKVGIASVSGGPYTYTSVGNVLLYSYTNKNPDTYYIVLQTLDAFGNVIATSNEVSATVQETVSFALSANSISFGTLTPSGPRYATTSTGSGTLATAHTITASSNASSGYTILYNGGTLANGANTITPATISGSTTGTAGTNQFALSLLSSGTATIPTTYDETSQNWNFAANTLATIASTSGPTAAATLNAYYLANAAVLTPAGSYATTLTYEMTANY